MKSFSFKIEKAVLSLVFVFVFHSEYNVETTDKIGVGIEEHQDQYLSLKKFETIPNVTHEPYDFSQLEGTEYGIK
ncbi:hypothetical protein BMS3Abin04_02640 [bacterium BMS3Abin04]|nr:hypothetical protein BMS3Abin04_02640 [bacterium BMS3Abin04]